MKVRGEKEGKEVLVLGGVMSKGMAYTTNGSHSTKIKKKFIYSFPNQCFQNLSLLLSTQCNSQYYTNIYSPTARFYLFISHQPRVPDPI